MKPTVYVVLFTGNANQTTSRRSGNYIPKYLHPGARHTEPEKWPRVEVSTAAFHARVRGSFLGPGGLKERNMFLPHPLVKLNIVGSLCDQEVACSASDLQSLNFASCVWRAVSSHSSHHPQEVLLAQFSLHVFSQSVLWISLACVCCSYIKLCYLISNLQEGFIEINHKRTMFHISKV